MAARKVGIDPCAKGRKVGEDWSSAAAKADVEKLVRLFESCHDWRLILTRDKQLAETLTSQQRDDLAWFGSFLRGFHEGAVELMEKQ
jgi:hypothetical protein